jgi:hypothetical protein
VKSAILQHPNKDSNQVQRYLFLFIIATSAGCASKRLLQLENRSLQRDLLEAREQIDAQQQGGLPRFDSLVGHLHKLGLSFDIHPDGPYALSSCPGHNTPFSAQIWEESGLFYLATTEFFDIRNSHSTSGAFGLMAQISTINYDLPLAKLAINEKSGLVVLSVQAPADEGLSLSIVRRCVLELCSSVEKVRSVLEKAAQGNGL